MTVPPLPGHQHVLTVVVYTRSDELSTGTYTNASDVHLLTPVFATVSFRVVSIGLTVVLDFGLAFFICLFYYD